MAFFNEFKDKFNKAAQSVTNKTKEGVEITRLSSESRSLANELTAIYEQIGRTYADSKGADEATLTALCAKASELRDRIEELERQKMQIRNQNRCPACGAVMARNARFCSSCGRRMPEPTPEEESIVQSEDVSYCPSCGAMRKGEERFCEVCGHSYESDAEPTEQTTEEERSAEASVEVEINESADEAPGDFTAE